MRDPKLSRSGNTPMDQLKKEARIVSLLIFTLVFSIHMRNNTCANNDREYGEVP